MLPLQSPCLNVATLKKTLLQCRAAPKTFFHNYQNRLGNFSKIYSLYEQKVLSLNMKYPIFNLY